MTNRLFISYRREDAGPFAEAFYQALAAELGRKSVVFDQFSIPPGVDFRDFISRQIHSCDILLAIIGPAWVGAEKSGQRRLDQEDDLVRVELETALEANKHVMPVLINAAVMPVEEILPASVKALAYKNAFRFGGEASFNHDLQKLVDAVHEHRRPRKIIRRLSWTLALVSVLSISLGVSTLCLWMEETRADSVDGTKANLGRFDPRVFTKKAEEDIKVARAFPNRESLDKATSIKDEFLGVQRAFDLFVFSGKSLAESETAMIDAVNRGVRVRIILVDQSPQNESNVTRYLSMIGQSGRSVQWYKDNYASTMGILQRVRESAPQNAGGRSSFGVRTYSGPFSNSFWVCDAEVKPRRAAHIAITLYGDDRKFPSVRFGDLSGEVVDNLAGHFKYLWEQSHEAFPDP